MMSIKTVNALSTTPTGPWATCTPARWAGWPDVDGLLYHLIPRMFGRKDVQHA